MRWKYVRPDVGERRVKRKFLLWPRSYGGITRWLEFADILEEFTLYVNFVGAPSPHWEEIGFAKEEQCQSSTKNTGK